MVLKKVHKWVKFGEKQEHCKRLQDEKKVLEQQVSIQHTSR
jgi:hypothetical protein